MNKNYIAVVLVALVVNLAAAEGKINSEVVIDGVAGFQNTPLLPDGKWHVHDPARPQPPVVTPGKTFNLSAAAPTDAEVLFDGTGLAKWQSSRKEAGAATWKTNENYMESAPKSGGIRTRGAWADFQLHIEWATPNPPHGEGQARGNSGVLINNMYEVQVLDSFQAKTYPDGQAGAVYGQMPPLVNVCQPPGEWQSYDIIFESPRWNEKGKLIKKAVVTVLQNGVVIQNHYELLGATDGVGVPWCSLSKYPAPHAPEVFIGLQDHSNPVRYRNIWIRSLHLNQK